MKTMLTLEQINDLGIADKVASSLGLSEKELNRFHPKDEIYFDSKFRPLEECPSEIRKEIIKECAKRMFFKTEQEERAFLNRLLLKQILQMTLEGYKLPKSDARKLLENL